MLVVVVVVVALHCVCREFESSNKRIKTTSDHQDMSAAGANDTKSGGPKWTVELTPLEQKIFKKLLAAVCDAPPPPPPPPPLPPPLIDHSVFCCQPVNMSTAREVWSDHTNPRRRRLGSR